MRWRRITQDEPFSKETDELSDILYLNSEPFNIDATAFGGGGGKGGGGKGGGGKGGGGKGGGGNPFNPFNPSSPFNPFTPGIPSKGVPGSGQNPLANAHQQTADILSQFSKDLNMLGLNSASKEVNRWAGHNQQVANVMTGKYHDDLKQVEKYKKSTEEYGNRLNDRVRQYNLGLQELYDRLERLVAFDEIFHMAYGNRINDFQTINGPELEIMTKEYELMMRELKRLIAELKNNYDFVIGLTEGAFLQRLIGSFIMIIGGLESDLGDLASGKFDSNTFKRIVMNVVAIVMVILSVFTYGLTLPVVIGIILLFMNLDGMYANGAATGAIMSALDFIFNDLLNLDSLIGSDFEKFDKDHEDYQEMVGYIKLAMTIYLVWTGLSSIDWGDIASNFTTTTEVSSGSTAGSTGTSTSYLDGTVEVGNSLDTSSFLGIKLSTYSEIYEAYTVAKKAKDFVSMNDQYKQLESKLKSDHTKLNDAISTKTNKRMMKHYKDSAYFLQDQQEYIDRYVWSMTSQNMYVDPYGTTPVANMRFTPDKDTRGLSFGFEDMFDESTQAGSKAYFNNIIYG